MNHLYFGNCHDVLQKLPDKSSGEQAQLLVIGNQTFKKSTEKGEQERELWVV